MVNPTEHNALGSYFHNVSQTNPERQTDITKTNLYKESENILYEAETF